MTRTWQLPLTVALTILAPPRWTAAAEATHVLVVGHNQSQDVGVRPLRFADDDAARYWELFTALAPARQVSLLAVLDPETARLHPEATAAARVPWSRQLKEAVARIRRAVTADNRAGANTHFIFIYIGHGNVAADGEGYVSLQDTRLRRRDLFREVIDQVPAATIHVIIDACKSYFLLSRGPEGWRDDRTGRRYGQAARAFLDRQLLAGHPHVGVILSTSGDEEVHEWSALHSGVFSHQLRSALGGAADINGDGSVEYSEVGAFIAAANQRVTHQRARIRPFIRPPPADRHAPLFRPGAMRLRLELAREEVGRFSLEDDRGTRVADLNKAYGTPLYLGLAPKRRYYIQHGVRESILEPGREGLVRLASLPRVEARAASRGSVDAAYRSDLFALPFSRSFYEGYLATTDLPTVRFSGPLEDGLPAPARRRDLDLALGYTLAPAVLDFPAGLQHGLSLGLRWHLRNPFFLAGRAELGISRHEVERLGYSLVRVGVLAGAGIRYLPTGWIELALQLDVGYQALIQTGAANSDPTGAKLGSRISIVLHPWREHLSLGLELYAGLYGHVVTVGEREMVYARPEGGLGLIYGF